MCPAAGFHLIQMYHYTLCQESVKRQVADVLWSVWLRRCSQGLSRRQTVKHWIISYHQDGSGQLSESDALPRRHQRREIGEGRTFHHHRALNAGSGLRGDPACNIKISSITGHPKSSLVTEKTLNQEPFISQVPLLVTTRCIFLECLLGCTMCCRKNC